MCEITRMYGARASARQYGVPVPNELTDRMLSRCTVGAL
jgi:hypothetical protein